VEDMVTSPGGMAITVVGAAFTLRYLFGGRSKEARRFEELMIKDN
jgi:hypothetical protein